MKIFDFDTKRGTYQFEVSDLATEIHSHPVVEIIHATQGSFKVYANGQSFEDLTLVIIDSNVKHQLIAENCTTHILMLESHNAVLTSFLKSLNIEFDQGIYISKNQSKEASLFSKLTAFSNEHDLKNPEEDRVKKCLEIIEGQEVTYQNLMTILKSEVCLSDSRLSHLFKEHIGVSIKKYLVWHRLKLAFDQFLNSGANLTEASVQSDFYDQAHLSNAFKSTLGINPSKVYNSRTFQL